jgi:two-component system chemotaxis sensor kinase CheA
MPSNADFLKKLAATFLVEAREHVQTLGACLIDLEKATDRDTQMPVIETLFREAHSLKGAARAVNAGKIERLCQTLESIFGNIKSGKATFSVETLDRLHREVTALGLLVEENAEVASADCGMRNAEGGTEVASADCGMRNAEGGTEVASADCGMRNAEGGTEVASTVRGTQKKKPEAASSGREGLSELPRSDIRVPSSSIDSVRIATSKLDAILVEAEELLGVKLAHAERMLEFKALTELVAERDRLRDETMPLARSLRQPDAVAAMPVELSSRLLALLDLEQENADAVGALITNLSHGMADDRRRLDTLVDRLLEDVKKTLMLPFENILAGFPKMVRDMARDTGKDIELKLSGTDIEIDKRILEQIKDPLLHLIRNSLDHGIEPPAERIRRGKPPRGVVTVAIAQTGGKVEIAVGDDGRGIDVAAVKAAAGEAATLQDQDAWHLVFRSGVTTSRKVTAISGRGLGMAIVHENVTRLGGTVGIASTAGAGTTVRIRLPLTLATLRGTVVRVAHRDFIIPTASVTRAVRVTRTAIRCVENRDSICLDGTTFSLVRLADVLALPPVQAADNNDAQVMVLILHHGHARMGFAVDQVSGEQEVLAKPLGRLLPRVRHVAGAALFGTGRIVPILSVPDLLQTAAGHAPATGLNPALDTTTIHVKRLLVVDDSITTRTLLQNILESSGYSVKTMPDGVAALAALHAEPFDLVVSDVEMPRMDGFELAKSIRAAPNLAELPVILVTARETQDDRERGIDAGANAYIVKSRFEQGNLLDVIGRLI